MLTQIFFSAVFCYPLGQNGQNFWLSKGILLSLLLRMCRYLAGSLVVRYKMFLSINSLPGYCKRIIYLYIGRDALTSGLKVYIITPLNNSLHDSYFLTNCQILFYYFQFYDIHIYFSLQILTSPEIRKYSIYIFEYSNIPFFFKSEQSNIQ